METAKFELKDCVRFNSGKFARAPVLVPFIKDEPVTSNGLNTSSVDSTLVKKEEPIVTAPAKSVSPELPLNSQPKLDPLSACAAEARAVKLAEYRFEKFFLKSGLTGKIPTNYLELPKFSEDGLLTRDNVTKI